MRAGQELPPGPWLVCGLARSGQAAALALRGLGEEVIGVDAAAPDGAAGLARSGVEVHLDASGTDLIDRVRAAVKSPGVPSDAPAMVAARSAGLPVIGELELGWRLTGGPTIAVTGTNGKTTVVELIGHILREADRRCVVAGNVGRPLCGLAGTADADAELVIEASSFQLEDATGFAPDVSALLNITPDHLDRHGTLAAYREAKMRIFSRQSADAHAVLPAGFDFSDAEVPAAKITFGGPGADLDCSDGQLAWKGQPLLPTTELRLPGAHNVLNAAAAAAACLVDGVPEAAVVEGLATFAGVPHRLETIATVDGVSWVNDSKATNVDATLTALAAHSGGVHLIAGGQGKGQDFSPLAPAAASVCVAVHLIGEDAPRLGDALADTGLPVHDDGDLRTAVIACRDAADPGDTVLLAPACASFDQFADFEARGRSFGDLVRELVG